VLTLARRTGVKVVEQVMPREMLYIADEVFLTGTAAELTPLREIDAIPIGDGTPGPITREIQQVFDDALHGRAAQYADWLDLVPVPAR
jgi:branched-chain amino acid aminotransferase